jgi:UDP-N-acetylmuramoyl-tripeptide--D-alanyl-D-alanine ligase
MGRRPALWALRRLANLVVRRHRPLVVGITGSVGKTTTKELIAALLGRRYRVAPTAGGSEVGASLAVLGVRRARRWGGRPDRRVWLTGYARGLGLLIGRRKEYPEILVLEMAAGRPGELRRLTRAIPPDIAVVTHVSSTHLQYFGTVSGVAEEKAWVVRRVRAGGLAVLNGDDQRVRAMAGLTAERVLLVGEAGDADLRAEQVEATSEGVTARVFARRADDGTPEEWSLASPMLGARRLSGTLAALGVARALGVSTDEALATVRDFRGPPARLRPLRGRNGSTVLDDSFSASPAAMDNALEVLQDFPRPHRAVLGEMAELGSFHDSAHRQVGARLAPWLDELVAVGDGGRLIAASALEHGMDAARVRCVADAETAVRLLSDDHGGGTVLVKGSHVIGLDRVTRALTHQTRR